MDTDVQYIYTTLDKDVRNVSILNNTFHLSINRFAECHKNSCITTIILCPDRQMLLFPPDLIMHTFWLKAFQAVSHLKWFKPAHIKGNEQLFRELANQD